MSNYRTTLNSPLGDEVIVDLSQHAHKLTAYEDISDDLTEEQEVKIVEYIRTISQMSYDRISKRYDHWLEADRAHDIYVPPDSTEFREKAVIADTRAVTDTVVTYLMSALGGRNPMFQLEGLNRASRTSAAVLERILHQHTRRGAGEFRIAQHLLDCVRYGFAPTKNIWVDGKRTNNVINFDPRKAFPDPRVSWGEWEKMQFIVLTDRISTSALMQTGMYPKLEKYPDLRKTRLTGEGWDSHKWAKEEGRGFNVNPSDIGDDSNVFTVGKNRVLDEAWLRLSGYEIGVPNIKTIWLVCTIIDEEVCIRFQLSPVGQQYPVVIGGLFNDSHKTYSQSMYDLLLPMHDIATWLLRSRIDNVQAAMHNLIFADPTRVSIDDLVDRNPWGIVRTLPGEEPGAGVFIAQVPDITAGHWNDISALADLKQRVSAASDAQQGIPTPGTPHTATEIQRLTQLGSQRLGVLSRIISATSIRPLVRMQVGNIQDALIFDGSVKVDDKQHHGLLDPLVDDGFVDFTVADLQGDIDYLVVDGTLPIEPTRSPDTWLNLLQVLSQTGLDMEYKQGMIVEEAIKAMGVPDIDQFRISEQEAQEGMTPSQQVSMLERMRGNAAVAPEEDVANQVEKGNLIPANQAA